MTKEERQNDVSNWWIGIPQREDGIYELTREQILNLITDYTQQAIAEHEAKAWKKYPENVPPTQGEYWIELINGNCEVCEYNDFSTMPGWQGRFNHEVIRFRELPEPYREGGDG